MDGGRGWRTNRKKGKLEIIKSRERGRALLRELRVKECGGWLEKRHAQKKAEEECAID